MKMAAAELLGKAGDYSGYQKLLGLTDAQVAGLVKWNQEQNAPKVTGGGGGDQSMTLTTAKAMAKQGQFTDDVLRVLRNAGFNDEYLKLEYGYEPETEQETEALTDNNAYNGRVYQKIYNQIKTGSFNVSTMAGMIERADLTDAQKDALLTMLGY